MTHTIRIVVGIAIAVVFAFAMWRATLQEQSVTCDVCIEYEGRSACRRGAGSDRDMALRGAQSAACAVLASGVTRGMQCDRVVPTSIQCEGDPY